MNEQQLADTYEKLFTAGWRFVLDNSHPTGRYSQTGNMNHTYGWFVLAGHPVKGVPAGDSKKMWIAAQDALTAWM